MFFIQCSYVHFYPFFIPSLLRLCHLETHRTLSSTSTLFIHLHTFNLLLFPYHLCYVSVFPHSFSSHSLVLFVTYIFLSFHPCFPSPPHPFPVPISLPFLFNFLFLFVSPLPFLLLLIFYLFISPFFLLYCIFRLLFLPQQPPPLPSIITSASPSSITCWRSSVSGVCERRGSS